MGKRAYYPSPWKVEVEDHFTLGVRIHLRNIARHYFRRIKKKRKQKREEDETGSVEDKDSGKGDYV